MMTKILLIGLGAGAASGLLFASLATGSVLGATLFYLAPLPLLLAGLGWGYLSAAFGAVAASAIIAILLNVNLALYLLISMALPAAWLARLALMSRSGNGGAAEFYPIGRIVIWTGLIGAGLMAAGLFYLGLSDIPFREVMVRQITQIVTAVINSSQNTAPLEAAQIKALAEQIAVMVFPVSALAWMIGMLANLWMAGRILRKAGSLPRPWPDISALDFPARFHFVLPAMLVLAFMPGLAGDMALPFAAVCLLAYGMMGLAILHQITRRQSSRPFVLTGIYFGILLLGWPLLIVAILAIGEPVFKLRARMASNPTPPDSGT